MKHRSWRYALLSMVAVLLIGGGWIWLKEASAYVHNGEKIHELRYNQGPIISGRTGGGIGIDPGERETTADGRMVLHLTVVDLYSSGFVEGIGHIDIRLDRARTEAMAGPSSLTSNQPDREFPATQHMEFFPIFSIDGEEFHADQPARVVNGSVEEFPPVPGTTYVLVNKLTLTSHAGNTLEILPSKKFVVGG